MFTLINFCDLSWLCVFLSWLLPFLLGLLLGWLIWGKWKRKYELLLNDLNDLKAKYTALEEELKKCQSSKNSYVSEIALLNGRIKELEADNANKLTEANAFVSAPQTNIKANKFAALKEDNLQVVEGIGPKMNDLLNNNGIVTWANLASKDATYLRTMLDKEGNKYSMIDPSTWAEQAALARDGKWDELIAMQKTLDAGRTNQVSAETDSKVEKIMVKLGILKRYNQDDLKAVEGIGPKIEELLHNAGIKTWLQLSNTSVESIQKILDDAGAKFSLADPETWPKQAKLASEGLWDEFEEYKNFLNRGKEK
ncbi:MAG: helix-hairpin-helix domain-containing protein [Saprospiraceae bacterium]